MDSPWLERPIELSEWPIRWRAMWGRLANNLEDQGIPWPEHERQAFETVKGEKERDEAKTKDETALPFADQSNQQASYFSNRSKSNQSKSKP